MNHRHLKAAFIIVGCVYIIGKGVVEIRQNHLVEMAKREQIELDGELDIEAIERAAVVMNQRIERGEIRSYNELRDSVVSEIAFQKIAIREE